MAVGVADRRRGRYYGGAVLELPTVDGIFGYFLGFVDAVKDYAIIALDPQGRVMTWNPGAERINRYTQNEIVGQFVGVHPPEDQAAQKPQAVLRHAMEHGRFTEEAERVRKGGSRFWASVVVVAIKDADGTLRGFAKITRDMTEKRLAEELEQERRVARERAKMRQRFLQLAAHELRDPMQAIKGMVESVRARLAVGRSLDDQESLLDMLDREVDRLSILLDEVREA